MLKAIATCTRVAEFVTCIKKKSSTSAKNEEKKSFTVLYLIGITSTKNGSLHDRITGEYFL